MQKTFWQQYTDRMLSNIEGQEPLRVQRATPKKLAALIKGRKKAELSRRPAPGKWSVAEIMAHLADTEIVVSWRMRQVLSSNGIALQPYDQDCWANTLDYAHRDPRRSLETFQLLRENNLALLKAAPRNLWENYGVHQERGNESVAHTVRMIAGHDINHLQQVEKILKAKR
jgi:hypothetical protein